MNYLSFNLPGYGVVQAPNDIPVGGEDTLEKILAVSITLIFVVAILVTLFMLMWAGIQWVTSEGDKQKLQNARNRITFTIIGLLVIIFSFFIVNFIGAYFGIPNPLRF